MAQQNVSHTSSGGDTYQLAGWHSSQARYCVAGGRGLGEGPFPGISVEGK